MPSLILPSGSGREWNTRKVFPGEAEGLPRALQIAALQGHPAQRAPATPAQEWPVPLAAGLGVLLAHGVDGARMQGEFLAAPRRQSIQIEAGRPALVPLQRLLLSLVAEIPDEIAGARLAAEQSGQRLDAVSIHQQHWRKLMPSKTSDKTLKLTETSIFTNTKPLTSGDGTSSPAQAPGSPCRSRDADPQRTRRRVTRPSKAIDRRESSPGGCRECLAR